jgi:hypothetical protein
VAEASGLPRADCRHPSPCNARLRESTTDAVYTDHLKFGLIGIRFESRINYVSGANSRSEAEQFAENMEFFAGGAEGGFLPKKEPSAIFLKEIGHFLRQLL